MTEAIEFSFSPDPKPDQKINKTTGKPSKPVGRPSKSSQQKELAEPIAMMLKMGAFPIVMRDPVCGGAIMEQADALADALAAQAMDSPRLRKWLEALSNPGGWINVGVAAWPIFVTVAQHHVINREEKPEHLAEHVHAGIDPNLFEGFGDSQ